MKRHIIGFAIFSGIVGSAVLVYSMFRPFDIPTVPTAITVNDESPLGCRKSPRSIEAKVITAEYDAWSGELVADVQLSWNGRGPRPERLYYSVFLLNKGNGPENWAINSDVAFRPFDGPGTTIERVRFSRSVMDKFGDIENIYAHIEAAEDGKFNSTQSERITTARYLPVLRVHH